MLVPALLLASAAPGAGQAKVKPATITGTLVDGFTGKPVASFPVLIRDKKTITDGEGRFRLEGVVFLDDGDRESTELLKIEWPPTHQASAIYDMNGTIVYVKKPRAATDVIDLGTLTVAADFLAEAAFGAACTGGKPAGEPQTPLLVFFGEAGGPWRHNTSESLRFAKNWWPPWKVVFCIEKSRQEVGRYNTGAAAYKTSWQVRVIRLSNGKAFRTKVEEMPPSAGDRRIGQPGDPLFKLVLSLGRNVK